MLNHLAGLRIFTSRDLHLLLSRNHNLGDRDVFDAILCSTLLFLARNLSWFFVEIEGARHFGTQEISIDILIMSSVLGQIHNTILEMMHLMRFFKRLDSVSFQSLFVEMGKLLGLFVGLARNKLELLWPDVLGFGQPQYLLSGDIDDHRGYLVTRISLVLEATALLDHFVEDLVTFLRNLLRSFLGLSDVFLQLLAFKENTISEEDLNIVDGHDESKVPIVERHKHPLSFHNICISWTLVLKL